MNARRLERLSANHDLSEFRSGNDTLDAWLMMHALASQQMGSARTFVLVDGSLIIGYFSLTMGSVLRTEPPATLVRGLPAYPVGVAMLTRLAVGADHHGQGIGARLLAEALRKMVAAGEAVAAKTSAPVSNKRSTTTRSRAACGASLLFGKRGAGRDPRPQAEAAPLGKTVPIKVRSCLQRGRFPEARAKAYR